jgi:hypothetical protein
MGMRGVNSWWGVSSTTSAVISTAANPVSTRRPRVRNTPCRHSTSSPTGGSSSVNSSPTAPRVDRIRSREGRSTRAV